MPRDLSFRAPPSLAVAENATTPTGRLGAVVWSTTERCYLTWDGSAWVNDLRTGTYPSIRPSLNLDFANTEVLDPRITFTRASEGRFYDGRTVAKAEENRLLRSQEFDNEAWAKNAATVTANATTAPDGTTTADTLTASGTNGSALQTFTAVAQPYTFSLWVRRTVGTGTVEITVDGTTWSAITISGTWARFSTTITPSAGSRTAGIRLATNGDAVEIWGAQLEQRSTVTAYTPTTTQPITNYVPQLMTAAANVARFDHNPVTGESLGLLIEEQRTNLLLRSAEISELAVWGRNAAAVVFANTNIAPDGTLSADTVQSNSGGNDFVGQTPTVANGTVVTFSLYVKNINAATSRIMARNTITAMEVYLAWSGSVLTTLAGAATSSGFTAVGNGWYRVWATYTTGEINQPVRIYSDDFSAGKSIFVWGAQLEAGPLPTSYIPTGAAQATRQADAATMTGTNFSSWYRQGEGTLYAEAIRSSLAGNDVVFAAVSDATVSNTFELYKPGNASSFQLYAAAANVAQASPVVLSVLTVNAPFKAVGAYRTNDIRGAANGNLTNADTSALIPVVNQLALGSRNTNGAWNGHIRKVTYWPIRLPDTQLQALTTL